MELEVPHFHHELVYQVTLLVLPAPMMCTPAMIPIGCGSGPGEWHRELYEVNH